jgi:predicted DNA-binding protein with PD1-like motif
MARETGFDARYIQQPGPPQAPRILAVAARGLSFRFELEPGVPLLEGMRRGFAARGFSGGVAELGPLALGPFAYVMPALSTDGKNAAFYSEAFRPAGITRVEAGAITFGSRDGAPFFHCHALWREAGGKMTGGHILPEETIVAERISITAFGLDGARFEGTPDPETNFKLFGPVAIKASAPVTDCRAFAVRLRPHQDVAGALEALCKAENIRRARIRGGVGSTIGARLAGGIEVANFATEVFIRNGMVDMDASGQPRADIEVGLVDYTGGIASGPFVNGDNPVLMTFELAIEEIPE